MSTPCLVIAGTHSGVGKTTVAVGLMAALTRRGFQVVPFKVGPDYLDPGYHAAACGRPSAPLDAWMLGEEGLRRSFATGIHGAKTVSDAPVIAVIEGMMGLHDGAEPDADRGSTAQLARLLRVPVILVLDGSALARSAGAVVLGYRLFDPEVPLVGVVANRVSGEGHARQLRPGIERRAELPLLGWIRELPEIAIPERHLGLVMAGEREGIREQIAGLSDMVEQHLDIERLLELAAAAAPLDLASPANLKRSVRSVRVALAGDEAFCFYYPDNLALLEAAGAELVSFSPLRDAELPAEVQGVYLGGGYPELHAARLAGNTPMRQAVRALALQGVPLYAECGGFMYLCESLIDADGEEHSMVGVVPGRCIMERELQAIGYREVTCLRDTVLGPLGTVVRGHEFHHSRFEGAVVPAQAAFRVGERHVGFAHANVLTSYVHLHFGSNPSAAESFVQQCLAPR